MLNEIKKRALCRFSIVIVYFIRRQCMFDAAII